MNRYPHLDSTPDWQTNNYLSEKPIIENLH